ncbi:hypothetical protein V1503_13605 [Bacillus sp. SCS-151]|uniref:hypothetical protein n=1 Tax=Nanhaiella sioensis TaxID=3115293 RepID=UPI00397A7CD5
MSQYKKVTTCCGSTIKEGKMCDCPCQLIVDNFNIPFNELDTNATQEIYNGRVVGFHGNSQLTIQNPVDEVVINFTSNGIVQPITLNDNDPIKVFSFQNVTRVEVMCIAQGGSGCTGSVNFLGMTETCK